MILGYKAMREIRLSVGLGKVEKGRVRLAETLGVLVTLGKHG